MTIQYTRHIIVTVQYTRHIIVTIQYTRHIIVTVQYTRHIQSNRVNNGHLTATCNEPTRRVDAGGHEQRPRVVVKKKDIM